MSDAPERIWAKIHGASTDVMSGQRGLLGAWHECQREGHTSYIRADLVTALEAENQRLRASLQECLEIVDRVSDKRAYRALKERARAALRSTEASHDD